MDIFPIAAKACRIFKTPTEKYKKSNPAAGLEWPRGFQEVKVPRFHDNGTEMVVRLSALRTGRLYGQEIHLVLISVRG
jgi:hypothetical protein